MAQVQDEFTVASNELLSVHVPTTSGTGYTAVYDGGIEIRAESINDDCAANSASTPAGRAYTAQPNPTVAEYDITFVFRNGDSTATRGIGVFARHTDNDNVYGFQLSSDGQTFSNKKIFKRVSGTNTELGAEDTNLVLNDTYKIDIRDASKKLYVNDVETISTTDNALTSAGGWGIAVGNFAVFADLTGTRVGWRIDNFTCTEVAGGNPGHGRIRELAALGWNLPM